MGGAMLQLPRLKFTEPCIKEKRQKGH